MFLSFLQVVTSWEPLIFGGEKSVPDHFLFNQSRRQLNPLVYLSPYYGLLSFPEIIFLKVGSKKERSTLKKVSLGYLGARREFKVEEISGVFSSICQESPSLYYLWNNLRALPSFLFSFLFFPLFILLFLYYRNEVLLFWSGSGILKRIKLPGPGE